MSFFLILIFIKHDISFSRMPLIPHQYGHGALHSRMYLISTTHFYWFLFCLVRLLLVPYLTSPPRIPAIQGWRGNITGGHLADTVHGWLPMCRNGCRSQIFWGSCWLQPGVHLLLFGKKCVSLSPACDHGEKPAAALFQMQGIARSETSIHISLWISCHLSWWHSSPASCYGGWFPLSWRLLCHATTCGNVPVMLIFDCQRAGRILFPLHLIADGIFCFYSLLLFFLIFFLNRLRRV